MIRKTLALVCVLALLVVSFAFTSGNASAASNAPSTHTATQTQAMPMDGPPYPNCSERYQTYWWWATLYMYTFEGSEQYYNGSSLVRYETYGLVTAYFGGSTDQGNITVACPPR